MATAHRARKQKKANSSSGQVFRIHTWGLEKYRKTMPTRKYRRLILWGIGIVIAVVIGFQLAYPQERGLPFASVAGQSVRLMSESDIARLIAEKFSTTRVKVTVDTVRTIEFDLKSAGAEPNTERMIARVTDYPLWQRLIPGSILWQPARIIDADIFFTDKPFREFITEKLKELNFPPQSARLAIENGTLTTIEAIEGSEVTTDALLNSVSQAHIALGKTTAIPAPAKRLKAERYSKDLQAVRSEAESVLAHTVTITAEGKTFIPTKSEIASWLVLADEKGTVTLSIDKAKIKAYLETLNKEVGTPAGQTNISIVDGRETGRTVGASGRALAADAMVEQVAAGLKDEAKDITIQAQFTEIQPSVIFNSKYTTTQEGLQAYVNDVARTRNIRISIQQIDGSGWSANARANESTPSGSTFKLYVALVLFDKMDKGEIHWDDPMLDTTVAGCFERMTVASTNPCAEAWIAQFGREYINNFIYARGFSTATTFISGDAVRTTAADLTKFMIGLNNGSLISGAHRERLLDSLGRHPYRYGIPTGSQGVVHDKVGFLWDYIHDTAIVQHPRGTYVMTVMTKGYSYGTIANITREVERIMYP